jgi:dTDP-4-amino-4,6-dideoxygalactose transaminase
MEIAIQFNRPWLAGNEHAYVSEAIARGHISGDGHFTKRCHQYLEHALGVPKTLLTTSCTDALEMAALLLDLQPGDEVIVPSFTFVSTANAFALRGAKIVFADIRPDTLNIDERHVAALVTDRTRAVVPVHYAGVGCEMNALLELSERYHFTLVEDNAHGLFGKYRGQYLGTFGALATQSFHETKNFSCGEGGALILNDATLCARAEILREKGTNRSRFFRGQVDKYSWVDLGSSFLPSDLLAAFLFAQLEARERIQSHRQHVWETYYQSLAPWASQHGVTLPFVPRHCKQAYHMFYLVMPTSNDRDLLISHLRTAGIHSVFHYLPLHVSEMGRRFGGRAGDCPVSESIAERLVRLPFFNGMTEQEQSQVIQQVSAFNCATESLRKAA